jgi:hypothetical protein
MEFGNKIYLDFYQFKQQYNIMAVTKKKLLNNVTGGANSYMKTNLTFRALVDGTNLSFSSNSGVKSQMSQLGSNITIRQIDTFQIS